MQLSLKSFPSTSTTPPIIRISGRTHPITQVFLEDLIAEKIITKASSEKSRDDPVKIVPDVLVYLMEISPAGTRSTCWLAVQASASQVSRMNFAPALPPRLPRAAKDLCKSSTDVRKVIHSTNIAETSITVEDMTYVVDTSLHREQRFKPSTGVTLLSMFPTFQASVQQQAGRAGHV
ncbi:hypothetical protein MRX96_005173 [Rhipicephalus microplus]